MQIKGHGLIFFKQRPNVCDKIPVFLCQRRHKPLNFRMAQPIAVNHTLEVALIAHVQGNHNSLFFGHRLTDGFFKLRLASHVPAFLL